MEIDIDSYAALAQGDEDIEVELDERDLQDPNLLVNLAWCIAEGVIYVFML